MYGAYPAGGGFVNVRTLIIDDEEPARQELRFLLSTLPWLTVVSEAENASEGLAAIVAHHPDLVFLDIEMPKQSGIDLCAEIARLADPPQLIFATAYHHYAAQAFELCALDYILKPYHLPRVLKAAHKARLAVEKKRTPPSLRMPLVRLPVKAEDRVLLISYDDISVAYTDGRDVLVASRSAVHRTDLSLQELEARLENHNFFRVHRGYLVNLGKIREIAPWFNGSYVLKVEDFVSEVPVSRKQAKDFRLRVGL